MEQKKIITNPANKLTFDTKQDQYTISSIPLSVQTIRMKTLSGNKYLIKNINISKIGVEIEQLSDTE